MPDRVQLGVVDMQADKYLRRREAAKFLQDKYGVGSEKTLAKLACVGGGPDFHKVGRVVLYTTGALDHWVRSRLSPPRRSTSDTSPDQQVR